jgi:hypothetical protein
MTRAKNNAAHILLSLLIFTLPFNWFFKWGADHAYLRGIQIDYLLTRIYLQDLILFCLVIIYLYSFRSTIAARVNRQQLSRLYKRFSKLANMVYRQPTSLAYLAWRHVKYYPTQASIGVLALVVGLKTLATGQPSALISLWQLASALAVAYYLYKQYTFQALIKLIWKPLMAASLIQSSLGIYQFVNQKSLVGYNLLGEIDLSLPGNIARESYFGVIRSLPYGTMPHPNMLAGFLGLASVIVLLKLQITKPKRLNSILYIFLLGLFISVMVLTRSWVAISGMSLIIFLLLLISRLRLSLLFGLYAIITLFYILLSTWFYYQSALTINNKSIIRRAHLNQAGLQVLKDHLWLGTGINQSLLPIHTSYSLIAPADFIQPIHSILLIWLVETGLVGTSLSLLILISLVKKSDIIHSKADQATLNPSNSQTMLRFYPLLFILWLGLFDHYPLTLRQGQLMTTLAFALALSAVNFSTNRSSKS